MQSCLSSCRAKSLCAIKSTSFFSTASFSFLKRLHNLSLSLSLRFVWQKQKIALSFTTTKVVSSSKYIQALLRHQLFSRQHQSVRLASATRTTINDFPKFSHECNASVAAAAAAAAYRSYVASCSHEFRNAFLLTVKHQFPPKPLLINTANHALSRRLVYKS